MMRKLKDKKAFTLIELLVVIGVLGILVLLAAPKFLGYTKDAKLVQVKSDIRTLENSIAAERTFDDMLLAEWSPVSNELMEEYRDSDSLINKKGLVGSESKLEDNYFKIPESSKLIKTKLNGDFILAQGGSVYYYEDGLKVEKEANIPEEVEGPSDVELGMESDFDWVKDESGYVGLNGEIGYFNYIGTGDEVVEIPHEIQGVEMTSYYRMFYKSGKNIKNIISTNTNIVDSSYMFELSEMNDSLDLSELNTSSIKNMSNMFRFAKARSLDLSNFNTAKVTDMYGMFAGYNMFGSYEVKLDLSSFDTSRVVNMSNMFSLGSINEITFGSKFDTSNVTDMSDMFRSYLGSSLDLSMFNTSKVTNMRGMFFNAALTEFDLRSFDTSNVTEAYSMFSNTDSETGYARTQEDADFFNEIIEPSRKLKFTVKDK